MLISGKTISIKIFLREERKYVFVAVLLGVGNIIAEMFFIIIIYVKAYHGFEIEWIWKKSSRQLNKISWNSSNNNIFMRSDGFN